MKFYEKKYFFLNLVHEFTNPNGSTAVPLRKILKKILKKFCNYFCRQKKCALALGDPGRATLDARAELGSKFGGIQMLKSEKFETQFEE